MFFQDVVLSRSLKKEYLWEEMKSKNHALIDALGVNYF